MRDVQPSDRTFEGGKPGSLAAQEIASSENNLTSSLTAKINVCA